MIEKLKEGLKDTLDTVSDKFQDSVDALKELHAAGTEKVSDFANDILGLSPLIEEAGFNMKDLNVDIGLPPSISIGFEKEKNIDPAAVDKLMEEHKDKKMLRVILQALMKADAMQKSMNLSHYKFAGVHVKLGIPPDVILKFVRNNTEN